jgi:L-rhamnose mutarotase
VPQTERHGLIVKLRPELREHYLELHRAVWPEVEQALTAHNVRNYSIFVHGLILIAYYEYVGSDHAADMARIAEDPASQKWWELTDPCQVPLEGAEGRSPWSEATLAWHLD